LGELEEDEFYFHEIIGCEVVSEDGELIGTVKEFDFIETRHFFELQQVKLLVKPVGADRYFDWLRSPAEPIKVTVSAHRLHKQFHLLQFKEMPSLNEVEHLRNNKAYCRACTVLRQSPF
jgi:ribosomal 30S subunit maturation factor RimM